ncbi:ABC transporter permease [Aminobacter sp. MSH1]|uniref:ABC transporter permease n=1 Tax=Aminobacter sp. MSH1 TaxID=374606 RepID=UPI00131F18B0|nr:ABC transporter permease [Aminobacter sp. MSH1]
MIDKNPSVADSTQPIVSNERADRRLAGAAKPLILLGITVLLVVASRWISPGLGGFDQVAAVIVLSSFLIVVAFGQQMVVLIGGLDLSVPSIIMLGGILAYAWSPADGLQLALVFVGVVLITGAVGAVSGLGVALLGIPPFIMTLSSGIIVYSAALGATSGSPGGDATGALEELFTGRFLGLPPVIFAVAVFVLLGAVLQSRTTFGRMLYATGTNRRAAEIAGLPVIRMTAATYAIGAAASGVCGMLLVGFSNGATLTMGQSYLLPSIAAVVVGGTAITGGRGDYFSVVAAALLMTTFSTVISSVQIAEGWRTIIYGLIVLVAIVAMNEETARLFSRVISVGNRSN